jgi:hypothetical protein
MTMTYTANSTTAVSVATTSTAVLPQNLGRRELTICNDGANIVYLGLGPTAATSNGIRLAASGGSYTTNLWKGAVSAIAVTGTTVITVAEF